MTSQVSDYTNVPIRELSIGDVVFGINDVRWGSNSTWKIVKLPEDFDTNWPNFILERVSNGERSNWGTHISWIAMVENRTFKYDPRQAGDTDEDI